MTEELNLFPMDGELPLKTHGFKVSSCLKNLPEVIVLYVGDTVTCLCKQNSCHDQFLYFSIQAEPEKMRAGWGGGRGELFLVVFCLY